MEAAIQTGAKVILFFRSHHGEKNTIESEVKRIEVFRAKVQGKCDSNDYSKNSMFEDTLIVELIKFSCD